MRILLLLPIITLFIVGCAAPPLSAPYIQNQQPEPEPEPLTVSELLKKRNYEIQREGDGYTIKYDYMDGNSRYKGNYSLHSPSTITIGDTTLEVEETGSLKVTIAGVGTQRVRK